MLVVELQRLETLEPSPLQPVPDEGAEIRSMDGDFLDELRDVLGHRLEETIAFGREFSVDQLAAYLKDLFGEALFFDSLIALLQQYALADVPLLAPTGRPTGTTGFHLALFGPPGTGKTFSIDDMIRGNPRTGVPPHGLPGRNRYCGGITPAQFLRVGASYTGRTFNFIVPEFNDWFKYKGMVEPLKLVMEQREVKWETTLGTVGPYTFHSFFSVNYNVRTMGASDYWTTIADPNFAALEDRMLLRFHPMTRERFRAVEGSAERLELGELDLRSGAADPRPSHPGPCDRDPPPLGGPPLPSQVGPARPQALPGPSRGLRGRAAQDPEPPVLPAAQVPGGPARGGVRAPHLLRARTGRDAPDRGPRSYLCPPVLRGRDPCARRPSRGGKLRSRPSTHDGTGVLRPS